MMRNSLEMLRSISPTPSNLDFSKPESRLLKVESVNHQLKTYRNQKHKNFEKVKATSKKPSKQNTKK